MHYFVWYSPEKIQYVGTDEETAVTSSVVVLQESEAKMYAFDDDTKIIEIYKSGKLWKAKGRLWIVFAEANFKICETMDEARAYANKSVIYGFAEYLVEKSNNEELVKSLIDWRPTKVDYFKPSR